MSDSSLKITIAEVSSSRKRQRHFYQEPGEAEVEEEQRVHQESAGKQPPAARLYKHALESIFGFLSLKELAAVLAVSHPWSSAVGSMCSIGHTLVGLPAGRPLFELCASRLARHIGTVGAVKMRCMLSQEQLYIVGRDMTRLHTLYCQLPAPLLGPLLFPPSLTKLIIDPSRASAQNVSLMIAAASRLPALLHLIMVGSQFNSLLDLAPLRLSAVTALDLCFRPGQCLSLKQADDLRAMPNLTALGLYSQAPDLRLILRVPHQLRLQTLDLQGVLDEESTALVASLPLLSRVNLFNTPHVRSLNLPNVQVLQLSRFSFREQLPSPEQMIQGLQASQINGLFLFSNQMTAAHVSALLSCMPAVEELHLEDMGALESLSFLSSEPLVSKLNILELAGCRHLQMRADQLYHVYSLKQLTLLEIRDCFSERLDSLTLQVLKELPSTRLPKLVTSTIDCDPPAAAP